MTERIVEIWHGWNMSRVSSRVAAGWVWLGCISDTDGDVLHVLGRPESVLHNAHETD